MHSGFSTSAGTWLKASQALQNYLAVLAHLAGSNCVEEYSQKEVKIKHGWG